MFTDFSQLIAQSELHRKELLAEADNHRLVKLALSLRRHPSRETQPAADPPEPAGADGSADSNSRGERRYAVSR